MSVRVMSWVWGSSRSRASQRLVLLAIADCANDAGSDAYPSMATLKKKTGLSERAVQVALKGLVDIGEVVVNLNGGPRGCNRYRVVMTPADSAPPQILHPAEDAPPQDLHHPPAESAPLPPQNLHPNHPLTIHEPSVKPSRPVRADVEEVCEYLADRIVANGSRRPRITAEWRRQARLLLDKDHRTVEQIRKAVDWCQADKFWQANILSMPKLREKYDQLRLAAQRPTGRSPTVEVDGLRLNPTTAQNLARRNRFVAQDNTRKALGS